MNCSEDSAKAYRQERTNVFYSFKCWEQKLQNYKRPIKNSNTQRVSEGHTTTSGTHTNQQKTERSGLKTKKCLMHLRAGANQQPESCGLQSPNKTRVHLERRFQSKNKPLVPPVTVSVPQRLRLSRHRHVLVQLGVQSAPGRGHVVVQLSVQLLLRWHHLSAATTPL